jgi:uncharacterized membrane protein
MTKKPKNFWPVEGVTRSEVVNSMSDTKFDFLRTARARKTLVLALISMLVVESLFSLIPGILSPILVLVGAILILWGYLALRASVRHVADAPDELLDERQIAARDRTYLHSYRILGALAVSVSVIFSILSQEGLIAVLSDKTWTGVWFSGIMLVAGIPNMVLAWTTTDK